MANRNLLKETKKARKQLQDGFTFHALNGQIRIKN